MAGYDWQEIFKNKDDKELIEIYSGNSLLDSEAELFAYLELKYRNFNFDTIETIHRRKIEQLKLDIKETENLSFKESKYYRYQIRGGIGFFAMLLFLFLNRDSLFANPGMKLFEICIYLFIFFGFFVTAKWSFNIFKKGKEEEINMKTELLRKITTPNSR